MHRTDKNGVARRASQGCLIIDGRQWRSVKKQLGHSQNIFLYLHRKRNNTAHYYLVPFSWGRVPPSITLRFSHILIQWTRFLYTHRLMTMW